ncbi:hypothetical protein UK23_40440 [Lentzea aerocolonigenes]|uniref:Uncharacterized protein n=1 Tax=Lentzea aerocolonigenes TaxID=68170 RepID=A0A0F0GEH2_LENAE|nr:hypothetical protein UK23_40440 [Lentzea aerocolonigenes]
MWATGAVVVAVAGGVVWQVTTTEWLTVITAIHPDGTVEWVEGESRHTEDNNSYTFPTSDKPHVAKLADDAVIRTAFGCATPTTRGLELSLLGLGTVECSREEFLAMEYPPYAPRLTFNWRGEITEIAGRYHP